MTVRRHSDVVTDAVSSASAAAQSALAASWRRSMMSYRLDPAERRRSERLTAMRLKSRREEAERMLRLADPYLDRLHGAAAMPGCVVLLADADGVILDHRCGQADAHTFQAWNLWDGASWSETVEGTNGIGTCLAEERRVVIHRDEHFAARNAEISCIDAPIHGPTGQIVGALDISSARADHSAALNRLMSEVVAQAARGIEMELFRAAYPGSRLVMADQNGTAWLAIDADDVVIGANRAARRHFGLAGHGPLQPVPAVDILAGEPAQTGLKRGEAAAIKRALLRSGGNMTEAAAALGIGRATLYRRAKRLGLRIGN